MPEKFLLAGSLAIVCIAAIAVLVLPRLAKDEACVSPLALGTVVSGDENGGAITVPPGATVTLRLGAAYNTSSTSFPQSSNPSILRAATLCSQPQVVSSLPSSITVFRAVAPGRADVTLYPEPSGYSNLASAAASPVFRVTVVVETFDIIPWVQIGALVTAEAALIYWVLFRRRRGFDPLRPNRHHREL